MIRCPDRVAPPGDWIATSDGFVALDDETLMVAAQYGMLAAMSPRHAEQLLDEAEAATAAAERAG